MPYNKNDLRVIGECLRAAVEGPFFEEWEFQTLFGLTRREVAAIAAAWPNVDLNDETAQIAATNAMVNLLGYPHGQDEEWSHYISAPPEEVRRILDRAKQSL
jgi:hypothetical protein